MPLGERTSKRGPRLEAGAWASKLNAQSSASAPALVNRAADNSNLSQVLWIRLREIRSLIKRYCRELNFSSREEFPDRCLVDRRSTRASAHAG